jgi:protease-4
MTLETEAVLDRRRLRRRLSWWRALAVIAAVVAIGALAFSSAEKMGLLEQRQIARVTIEGMITEDREMLRMFKKLAENKSISAVILVVNSPGGTTAGGEALFEAIRELSKSKPVVAQFGTLATSAAYIAGLATDYIVARGNSITGSVGVIFQWAEFSGLFEKLGVRMNEVKSGPLKAVPSPFQPMDEAGRAATEEMVAESFKWFVALVRNRRNVETKSIPGLEQGRVFSGRDALAHKLIDQIGSEPEAIRYLEEQRNVPKGLNIVDVKPQRNSEWSFIGLTGHLLGKLTGIPGMGEAASVLTDERLSRMHLDGLLSIWHGAEK